MVKGLAKKLTTQQASKGLCSLRRFFYLKKGGDKKHC